MHNFKETNKISIGDSQLVFDDCYEYFNGHFNNTTISMRNETQHLDRNVGFRLNVNEENEVPLLEELEIDPKQIFEKALTMINPFVGDEFSMGRFLIDPDLSGPLFFCFCFGSFLFLAGKVFIFSHMYGLMMISVVGLYGLLMLMNCYGQQMNFITLKGVASALGYGMQHLIWLSFIGIFIRLDTYTGFVLATTAIALATCGASRVLSLMINQQSSALIAYPTAIIYTLFVLLVVF